MEDYTTEFKDIFRQIEELHIEEIILNELDINNKEDKQQEQSSQLKSSYRLYEKWQRLIEINQLEELITYSKETKTVFQQEQDLLTNSETCQSQSLNREELTTTTTSTTTTTTNTTSTTMSTSELNTTSVDSKQDESLSTSLKHVEERNSSLLFTQSTDETYKSADLKPEKPTQLDIVHINRVDSSQPISSAKSLTISQSINEINSSSQPTDFNVVLCEPGEFVKCIEKLIQSTQTVEKHLDNIQKTNREFYEFEKQEIKLNAIKQTLESLAMALRTTLVHKRAILEKANKETSRCITQLIQTLTKQHHNVVQKYKEKNALYMKNYDKWSDFNRNFVKIQSWIDSTLSKLNELNDTNLDTERVQEIIKDFSNLTSYRLLLEKTYLSGNEILNKSNESDAQLLSDKLNNLNKKWKNLISLLNELKEKALQTRSSNEQHKLTKEDDDNGNNNNSKQVENEQQHDEESITDDKLNKKLNENNEWLLNCEQLIQREPLPVDELENERLIFELSECEKDLPFRRSMFENDYKLYSSKLKTFDQSDLETYSKNIMDKFEKLNTSLSAKRKYLETNVEQLRGFLEELNTMNNWINSLHLDLIRQNSIPSITSLKTSKSIVDADSTTSSPVTSSQSPVTEPQTPLSPDSTYSNLIVDSNSIKVVLNEKLNHLNDLKSIYATLEKQSNHNMPESIKNKMNNLLNKWAQLESDQQQVKASPVVELDEKLIDKSAVVNVEEEVVVETEENFDETFIKTIQQDSQQSPKPLHTTSVNVDDLNTDDLKKSSSLLQDNSVALITESNDDIDIISNDLFDWLLWIDHTLESHAITVGDIDEIQQSIQKFDSILNEINKKQEQLDRVEKASANLNENKSDSSQIATANDKLKQLSQQWKESRTKVEEKKQQSETMLTESRRLEQLNSEFMQRINEMELKIENFVEPSFGKDTLRKQKTEYKRTKSELNQLKQLYDEYKQVNEKLITKYHSNDITQIKLKYDRLSTRFNELNNRLYVRGDSITDALQMIEDFDGQVQNFSQWLYKIEQDLNYLEDYCLKSDDTNSNKQTVIELYQELQKEIDNQNDEYSNLSHTSQKILDSFKDKTEKDNLQLQLDEINKRWSLLRKKSLEIRSRLESNSAQWSALLTSLKELIQWCKSQQQQIIIKKQSLQPDLNITNKQINENKVFMCNIEYKKSIIESTLASAKLYYDDRVKNIEQATKEANETNNGVNSSTSTTTATAPTTPTNQSSGLILSNLKRKLSSKKSKKEKKNSFQELKIKEENENEDELLTKPSEDPLDDDVFDDELDVLNKLGPNEIAGHLVSKIDRKVQVLDRLWQELNRQSLNYNNLLINFYQNLQQINKSFELVNQKLNENEQLVARINLLTDIESDKLAEELEKIKNFQLKLSTYQPLIDDMCTQYQNINQELNNCVSFKNTNPVFNAKFDDLNLRWSNLQSQLQEKYLHMYSLVESSGANIFLKLSESVQMPWQRSVSSSNKVPYYINHASEMTSWDHPKMIDLYKSFTNLNDIRFSAYRTAMKLRTLQKRLWLDFVDINDAIEAFEPHKQNDKNLDTIQVIQCLNKLFQPAYKQNPQLIDIVLAVDLTLNWLLSVYDPSRCGQIRILSMKVAIILLCKGSIEDKYIHIFNLITDNKDCVTHRKLGLLLYDMIMIPKQLGEVAAFGGSNVEPSVRSCFEYAKVTTEINLGHFLEWLKLEPQSIVWLPVLHRLAAAETARHDAKCSICKEYPIVGFRYRSLKHFNFDVCQSCFFSGRKIKGFKFDHPLLEYYTPTSSSDDIKDFFRIFRNKFRSKRSRRSSKLGYLPVQSVLESEEFESPSHQSVSSASETNPTNTSGLPATQSPKHVVFNPPSEEDQLQQTKLAQQAQLAVQIQQKQQQLQLQQQILKQQQQEELKRQQKLAQQKQQELQQQQLEQQRRAKSKSKSKSPSRSIQQQSLCPSLTKTETNIISRSTHKVFLNEPVIQPKTLSQIKINESDDEHKLIAQFCNSLNGDTTMTVSPATRNLTKTGVILESTPSSQINVINDPELDQQQELENIINDLEEENMYLMEEYTRLQNQLNATNTATTTTTAAATATLNRNTNKNLFSINKIKTSTLQHSSSNQAYAADMTHAYHTISSSSRALSSSPTVLSQSQGVFSNPYYTSSGSLNIKNNAYNKVPPLFASVNQKPKTLGANKESQMLAEARLLRQHEDRLEARMKILENHNRLLDGQLKQLRNLLNNSNQAKDMSKLSATNTSNVNINAKKLVEIQIDRKSSERVVNNNLTASSIGTNSNNPSSSNIGALFHNVEDITRAINNLNNLVNSIGSIDK